MWTTLVNFSITNVRHKVIYTAASSLCITSQYIFHLSQDIYTGKTFQLLLKITHFEYVEK